jgi:membrane protease YdiL (CAAX protease family)
MLKDYYRFLRNPQSALAPISKWTALFRVASLLWVFLLLFSIIYSFLSRLVYEGLGIDLPAKRVSPFDLLSLVGIIRALVIAPIFEELLCRLSLKCNYRNVSLSGAAFVYTLLSFILHNFYNFFSWEHVGILSISFLSFFFFAAITKKHNSFLQTSFNKNYKLFFYILLLAFALAHISTYDLSNAKLSYVVLLPLVIVPQVMAGSLFAYIRLRAGIIPAILLHSFNNSIVLLLLYIVAR